MDDTAVQSYSLEKPVYLHVHIFGVKWTQCEMLVNRAVEIND